MALVYHYRHPCQREIQLIQKQAWENSRCYSNVKQKHPDTYEMMFPDEEYEEEQEERVEGAKETAKRLGHPT